MLPPKTLEIQYGRALSRIIAKLKELTRAHLFPALPGIVAEADRHRPKLDAAYIKTFDEWPNDIAKIMELIRSGFFGAFSDKEISGIAETYAIAVATRNKSQFFDVVKRVLGIDLFGAEPWLPAKLEAFGLENAGLIKNVVDSYVQKVQQSVFEGIRQGLRAEAIESDIVDGENVSESRAKFIARDQVNKLNGNLAELRQTEIGVSSYIWRTSLDDRVRDNHASKEGKQFDWSDPPADTGHPGEDFNCRCYAEPVLEDLIESP